MLKLLSFNEEVGSVVCPLFLSKVSAGFPSPADDFIERGLDLNSYLIKHPTSTYFLRVSGESMTGAGIFPGDILIVDKALKPTDGKIIIAILEGEFTVKRFIRHRAKIILAPENPEYQSIEIKDGMDFEVWGVVTHAIHGV